MVICKYCKEEIYHINSNNQKYHKECFRKLRCEEEREKRKNPKYKEYQRKYKKLYYIKNKERIYKKNKENYEKNKEKYCKKNKEYRENHKEQIKKYHKKERIKHRKKINARALAQKSIIIPKEQICVKCNKNLAVHKHHEDYSKPLEVMFVCVDCHKILDKKCLQKQKKNI